MKRVLVFAGVLVYFAIGIVLQIALSEYYSGTFELFVIAFVIYLVVSALFLPRR